MKTKKSLLALLIILCMMFSIAGMATFGSYADTVTSNWSDTGHATFTDNGDGSVTTSDNDSPFVQHAFTTPQALGKATLTDIAYTYNVKLTGNETGEILYTFNFGVLGSYGINIALYVQSVNPEVGYDWSNLVLNGGFPNVTYTLGLFKEGSSVVPGSAGMGPTTSTSWDSSGIIAWVYDTIGLKSYKNADGHNFVFRATVVEGGVLLRVYHGSISDNTLAIQLKMIGDELPSNLTSTYFGTGMYNGTATLSNVSVREVVETNWTKDGNYTGTSYEANNEDGSVTLNTAGAAAFNPQMFITPAKLNEQTVTDVAYAYSVKISNPGEAEHLLTFNFGILGGEGINIAFYYQNVAPSLWAWSNTVCNAGFSNATYTLGIYKNGVGQYPANAGFGPTNNLGWDTNGIIAWIYDTMGLKAMGDNTGHQFIFRATVIDGGVLLRIYYGTDTISNDNLIYSLKIEGASMPANLASTYFGIGFYNGEMTVSNVRLIDNIPDDEVEENNNGWQSLNPNSNIDYSDMNQETLQGSLVIKNKDASDSGFSDAHVGVPIKSLLGGTVDTNKDVAVTFTVKASQAGTAYSTEAHFWFYLYNSSSTFLSAGILNQGTIFTYAVTTGLVSGSAVNVISVNKDGDMVSGPSNVWQSSLGSVQNVGLGNIGREKTFTIVYSIVDGVGVMEKLYFHTSNFDLATASPFYTSMIYTTSTDVFAFDNTMFALRFFNTDVTLSNVTAVQLDKATDYIKASAEVNGDLGIWSANTDLVAAKYTANANGSITIDDTRTANSTPGLYGVKAKLDDIANDLDYKTEKDFVVTVHVNLTEMEREMVLWLNLIDANDNYVGIGLFYQQYNNEYRWTNSAVLSNSGNSISGYTKEPFGGTSVAFENKSYDYAGILGVPSIAFSSFGNANGHTFHIRYQEQGDNLVISLYYQSDDKQVNFETDEAIYKVVLYNYKVQDWSKMSFGFRGQCTTSTLNSCKLENYSALREASADKNLNDNDGNSSKKGCRNEIFVNGYAGIIAAATLCATAFVLVKSKKKD